MTPAKRRGRPAINANGELSESAFQARVIGLARFYGWRIFHAPDGGHSSGTVARGQIREGRGFPDLVLVRDQHLLFAELKSETGRRRPGQQDWIDDLNRVGDAIDAHAPARLQAEIWRPADIDAIHDRLAAGRVRQEPTW